MSREYPFRTNFAPDPSGEAAGEPERFARATRMACLAEFRDLLKGMGAVAIFLDEHLAVTSFTPAAAEIFQLTDSDIGKPIKQIPRQFHCACFDEVLERTARTGENIDAELRLLSGRWYLLRLHPLTPPPAPFAVMLGFVDITSFKQAKIERDQLAAIVQSSNDAIVGKNLDAVVTSWNPAAERMFGYTAQEMIGRSMMPMIPPEHQEPLPAAYDAIKRGEVVQRLDIEFFRKDGSRFPAAVTLSPTCDDAGQVVGLSAIIRDITNRKRTEERLAEQSRELARSNAELEQFAGVISHDLRSPLLSITGPLQLIEEELGRSAPAELRQNLKYARESVTRMGDLIKALLDYSRMAKQKPGQCDMKVVLEKALANLRAAITREQGVVTSDPLPVIVADEKLLVQVLQNLIENGLKYQDGSRRPEIHVLFRDAPSEWIFGVRDNGIGIQPQHFEKIFQIFQRLHGDEARYAGLGVGLATAKKIIERHGGRMWVESTPGEGSTFFFTLPKPALT